MFRIGVCDDEAYFRQDIEKRLEAYFKEKPFKPEIHIFEKGQALLEEAAQKPFDLVFLDIEMPVMDGITLGEKLRSIDKAVFLIYVTSHQEFISQAMRLEISQFLIKPLEEIFFFRGDGPRDGPVQEQKAEICRHVQGCEPEYFHS